MFAAPAPQPPPLVWVSQPDHEQLARAEAAWTPDPFLAAMKPGGATGAMSCIVLADGRLDGCHEQMGPDAALALQNAILALAGRYRLDPTGHAPGSRVTVATVFPKLFDKAPQIVGRPSKEEVAAAMPPGARGSAKLTCRVDVQGALDRCQVATPAEPRQADDGRVDTAALYLASKFTVRPGMLNGAAVETFEGFDVPVGPAGAPQVITDPDWVRRPTQEELLSALPARAVKAHINGKAAVQCRVLASGGLTDCVIAREDPAGYGFGSAAMVLTRSFVMKPKTVNGETVSGASVTIPIKWAGLNQGVPTGGNFSVLPWAPWAKAPTAADVTAAFPPRAAARRLFGHVTLRCRLTGQGVPRDCETQLENPDDQGFAGAARKLSRMFQAQVSELTPEMLQSAVLLTFDFSDRALAPAAPGRYVRSVDWVRSFDPARAQEVYPDTAVKAAVLSGRAVADCRIAPDGSLGDCSASAEAPAGMNFGVAAVRLAQAMQANLWTQDGEPTGGDRVELPIRLIYAGDPKEAPKAAVAAASNPR